MSEETRGSNILIAHPYPALYTGIRHIIHHSGHIVHACSLTAVIEHLRNTAFSILFLDDELPGMDARSRKKIICSFPLLKIIILTASHDKEYIRNLFAEGISGCMHKTAENHEYHQAVKTVLGNKTFHCSFITRLLITEKAELPAEDSIPKKAQLTERETEILPYLIKKIPEKQIADILCISLSTVITHRKNIRKKLTAIDMLYILDGFIKPID